MDREKKFISVLTKGYQDYYPLMFLNKIHCRCSVDNDFKTIEVNANDCQNALTLIKNESFNKIKSLKVHDTNKQAQQYRELYWN